MEFKDYYSALGVARDASAEQIKKAYRKLARKHHPDVSKAKDAHARMAEVNEANEVLSDPAKREAYDTLASAPRAREGHPFRTPPGWNSGFEFRDPGGQSGPRSDFFEQLFGRGRAGASRRAAVPERGEDVHARVELDLLDAYTGAERTITLRTKGSEVERQLQVRIPHGLLEGQQIRLKGRGGDGQGGGAAGDLLLEVRFKPDTRWRATGPDVTQRLPVTPWEAMLGTTAGVQTPGGEAEVSIPAGFKAGRKLRLKGRGIPGSGTRPAGDLYLELELALPPADSDAAKAAYGAFALAFPGFAPRYSSEGTPP